MRNGNIIIARCVFSPRRYMIPRYTDVEQFFAINTEDGMITTMRPLDRETQNWHNISVSATEIGTYPRPNMQRCDERLELSLMCVSHRATS